MKTQRSPDAKRAYFEGFNAAIEKAAEISRCHTEADMFKDVPITLEILALKQPTI